MNDDKEPRLPERRPFVWDLGDSKLDNLLEAYQKADQVFIKPKKKKKTIL